MVFQKIISRNPYFCLFSYNNKVWQGFRALQSSYDIENSSSKIFYFPRAQEHTTKDDTMKPCPHCLAAHWQTGGQTRVHYIPQFMESCRDCCDPGENELREKEQEQFQTLIHKARAEHARKGTTCENIIVVKNHVS